MHRAWLNRNRTPKPTHAAQRRGGTSPGRRKGAGRPRGVVEDRQTVDDVPMRRASDSRKRIRSSDSISTKLLVLLVTLVPLVGGAPQAGSQGPRLDVLETDEGCGPVDCCCEPTDTGLAELASPLPGGGCPCELRPESPSRPGPLHAPWNEGVRAPLPLRAACVIPWRESPELGRCPDRLDRGGLASARSGPLRTKAGALGGYLSLLSVARN